MPAPWTLGQSPFPWAWRYRSADPYDADTEPRAMWGQITAPAQQYGSGNFSSWLDKNYDRYYNQYRAALATGLIPLQNEGASMYDWATGGGVSGTGGRFNPYGDFYRMAPGARGETPSRFAGKLNYRM